MAKGKSGSDGKGRKERLSSFRKSKAAQRTPTRAISQQEAGTPF